VPCLSKTFSTLIRKSAWSNARPTESRRPADSDEKFSCMMDGMAIGLKACFVKKA
jgi:hypothetical protein